MDAMASRSTLGTVSSDSEVEEDLQPMVKRESISWVIRTGRSEADQLSARLDRLEQLFGATRQERLQRELFAPREELKSLVQEEVQKELRSLVRDEVNKALADLQQKVQKCSEMESRLEAFSLDKVNGLRCEHEAFFGTGIKQIHGWCSQKMQNQREEMDQTIAKAVGYAQATVMQEVDQRAERDAFGVRDLNVKLNDVIAKMDQLCSDLVHLVDKSPGGESTACPTSGTSNTHPSPPLTSRSIDSVDSDSSYLSAVKAPRKQHEESLLQPLLQRMKNEGRLVQASPTLTASVSVPQTPEWPMAPSASSPAAVHRRLSWGCATEYRTSPPTPGPVLLGAAPLKKRVQVLYTSAA